MSDNICKIFVELQLQVKCIDANGKQIAYGFSHGQLGYDPNEEYDIDKNSNVMLKSCMKQALGGAYSRNDKRNERIAQYKAQKKQRAEEKAENTENKSE